MRTSLWQVSVIGPPETEEILTRCLEACLAQTPSVFQDILRLRCTVSVHLPKLPASAPQVRLCLRRRLEGIRRAGVSLPPFRVKVSRLKATDWAEAWKQHFPLLRIGRALVVRPPWIRVCPQPGQVVLELEPGLSFGTGHHPTTQFCLRQLVACRDPRRPQSALDIGTGSGLLALAAAALGYTPVRAFDSDPLAVRVARANARKNPLGRTVRIRQADVRRMPRDPAAPFDLVCANLTADLLVEQRGRIATAVRPGGVLLLAGILERELPAVADAYHRCGFDLERAHSCKGWRSGRFRRRA